MKNKMSFGNNCDIVNFHLIIVICGYVAVRGEVVFNVSETIHLRKDNLVFNCYVNPSVQVNQLYYIKLNRLYYNNEWKDIVLLRPFGNISFALVWYDAGFEGRILTNTSKTETGILWLNVPVEKVLLNDTGTFKCIASWLAGNGPLFSEEVRTVDVVDSQINSSVSPVITTYPITNPSYESSTPSTTEEVTGPDRITPYSTEELSGTDRVTQYTSDKLTGTNRVTPYTSDKLTGTNRVTPYTSDKLTGTNRVTPYTSDKLTGPGSVTPSTTEEVREPDHVKPPSGSNATNLYQGSKDNTALSLGLSIGCVVLIIGFVAIFVAIMRRKKRNTDPESPESEADFATGIGMKYHPYNTDMYGGQGEFLHRFYSGGTWSEADYINNKMKMEDFQIKRPHLNMGYSAS